MLGWLILALVLLPLADLVLLVRIGAEIGFLPTLALLIGTAILGTTLSRRQGLGTLAKINHELRSGRTPTTELAEGLLILVAGAALIWPGYISDAIGLLLLVPPIRSILVRGVAHYFRSRVSMTRIRRGSGRVVVETMGGESPQAPDAAGPAWDVHGGGVASSRRMKYVRNEAMERESSP